MNPSSLKGTAAVAAQFLLLGITSAAPNLDVSEFKYSTHKTQTSPNWVRADNSTSMIFDGINSCPTQSNSEFLVHSDISLVKTIDPRSLIPLTGNRSTTLQETLVGEIRSWGLLNDNWDGEGSLKPHSQSSKEAVSFVNLLGETITAPEPMLLSSGHIALFWNDHNLYADIEFLGDGRIAYFIKVNDDKHKGVLEFDSQQMPTVFKAILLC